MRKIAFLVLTLILGVVITACESDGLDDPNIVNANSIDGSTNVAVTSIFRYNFAASTSASEITTDTYFLVQAPQANVSPQTKSASVDPTICDPASKISATVSIRSNSATLTPSSSLSGNSLYALCFLPEDFQATFTTAGGSSSVTVTLAPADAATNKIGGTAVTATFSGAITEPTTWTDVFTLKLDNAGSNLCTSVTYNSSTYIATCNHAPMTFGSSYTVAVSGITGVTDPTPTTFTTSSIFGGVDSYGGLILATFNTADSTLMIKDLSDGTENGPFNYVLDGPGKYLVSLDGQFVWYISGDFLVGQVDAEATAYGIMIDPNVTSLDFMLGKGYGGQGFRGLNGTAGVGILSDDNPATADAEVTLINNKNGGGGIEVAPSAYPAGHSYSIGSFEFNSTDYYFSSTNATFDMTWNRFVNEDGYMITQEGVGATITKFCISSENPPTSGVPTDVEAGFVFKGYDVSTAGEVTEEEVTIVSNDGTTLVLSDGEESASYTNNGTNVNAGWPVGYYATDGSEQVVRLYGTNAITITEFGDENGYISLLVR